MTRIRAFVQPSAARRLATALRNAGVSEVRLRSRAPLTVGSDVTAPEFSCSLPLANYPRKAEVIVLAESAQVADVVALMRRHGGRHARISVHEAVT